MPDKVKVAPIGERTEKCSVGGVFKAGGRMCACAYSMTGQGCSLVKGECEYQVRQAGSEATIVDRINEGRI